MKKLYDTSALLNLLLSSGSKSLDTISGQAILDLTKYELGNSIWQFSYLQKKITKKEACALFDTALCVLDTMNVLTINGIEGDIQNLSIDVGESFYDISYVGVAKKYNLELITDDKKLQKKARECKIKVSDSGV